ncbi:MAG: transporter substrate-binding domain-containing protein [Muribaculaceae bacterium]|nr:transporter substrate-binding domain-containing protein [Muribaculaceae bacterium]
MIKNRRQNILTLLIILAVFALTAIGMLRRCEMSRSTLANDFRRPGGDTLSVAMEMSPLTFTFSKDTASGFDYQILKDIARKHGINMKFCAVGELDDAFQGLKDGKYDILVASMPKTNVLKKHFPLTDAVYLDRQVVVQLADTASASYVRAAHELAGDTVWIPDGSPGLLRLRNLSKELGDSVYVAYKEGHSAELLAIMTALGKIPRAVVGEAVARRVAVDYPALDISTPVSLSQLQCWAVAPGDSVLLDSLNRWLEEFKATPEYEALVEKYLR